MKNIFIVQLLTLIPFALLLGFSLTVLILPALRREKCRLLVDLVAGGIRRGQSPENTLTALAHLNDPSLGFGIYTVCWRVERGQSLPDALAASAFFPRELSEVFRAGYQLGNLESILPAAKEAASPRPLPRNGAHYLILSATIFSPLLPILLLLLSIYVYPKLRMLFLDIGETALPPLTEWVFNWTGPVGVGLLVVSVFVYLGVLLYAIAGPTFRGPWFDRCVARVPWVALRLRRKFVSMLARLLDGSIPEARALDLAASSVGNQSFVRLGNSMQQELVEGKSLDQALQRLDSSGQLGWRIRNSGQSLSMAAAVNGWVEMMEEKAFQSHQTWLHLLGVGSLLFFALLVGLTMVAVFMALIGIINAEVLW